MVRSYEDEVQVRVGQPVQVRLSTPQSSVLTGGPEPRSSERTAVAEVPVVESPAPTAFLWRGRLYVVREVLAHWYERRAWWSEGAARAVHGQGEAPAGQVAPGADRQVWRVEAGAGRQAGTGVYDLCHDAPGGSDAWSLLRVVD